VISTASNTVVATIAIGPPAALALDPTGQYLYVALTDGRISVIATATNTVVTTFEVVSGSTLEGMLATPASLAISGPTKAQLNLLVTVNEPTFSVQQTLTGTVGVNNPGLTGAADVYLGMVLPDNTTIAFLTSTGGIAMGSVGNLTSFRPVATGVSLATAFSTIAPDVFSYQWTGTEPRGTYVFFLLAVTAGALGDGALTGGEILALATASVSFP